MESSRSAPFLPGRSGRPNPPECPQTQFRVQSRSPDPHLPDHKHIRRQYKHIGPYSIKSLWKECQVLDQVSHSDQKWQNERDGKSKAAGRTACCGMRVESFSQTNLKRSRFDSLSFYLELVKRNLFTRVSKQCCSNYR